MYHQWAPYVPVAERRRKAAGEMAKQAKKGKIISPVRIEGRAITTTVWGKAWCTNLERYSDYANRLPRGRTYVRNGSVVHLQVHPGRIEAQVSGSSLYETSITVKPLGAACWKRLCEDCAGGIDSLVELLQGRFANGVMERLCRQGEGLFPVPKDIHFDCSCPDGASMCKHVAAVLYGIGARFDHQPELLFTLRQVDASDLLAKAGAGISIASAASERILETDDVGALFDLDLDTGAGESAPVAPAPIRSQAKPKAVKKAPRPATPTVTRATSAGRIRVAPKPSRTPQQRLVDALGQHGSLDNAAARAITGLGSTEVRLLLQGLVAKGLARTIGQKRGTRYVSAGKTRG